MRCNKCGNELRVGTEQVGVDDKNLPIVHRFGYCDNCRMKWDLDVGNDCISPNESPNKNRNIDFSTISLILGISGFILTFFVIGIIPSVIGLVLGIVAITTKKPNRGRAIAGTVLSAVSVALFITILVATMVSPSDTQEEKKSNVSQTETNNEKEAKKAEKEKAKKEVEKKKQEEKSGNLTVGSTFEENGLKMTINEANTDFQDYDNEYGWNTPEDGMKYIMVSFTFENTGKSDEYVSIYDFECYADNTTMDQVFTLDDSDFMNTNLSPGRNISFKTYYTVPVNAQSIELEYETNMWTEEKVVIKVH